MRKYRLLYIIRKEHFQVYLENEFAIGIEWVGGIFSLNLVFLKINIF